MVPGDQTLQFAMSVRRMSLAPRASSSSIISMALCFGTRAETATQSGSSRGEIVGARDPGVILTVYSAKKKEEGTEEKVGGRSQNEQRSVMGRTCESRALGTL